MIEIVFGIIFMAIAIFLVFFLGCALISFIPELLETIEQIKKTLEKNEDDDE